MQREALPLLLSPLGVGASSFSVVHICGPVAAGMCVCAISHVAEENAHTAAVSANAIATVARGQTKGARSRALGS